MRPCLLLHPAKQGVAFKPAAPDDDDDDDDGGGGDCILQSPCPCPPTPTRTIRRALTSFSGDDTEAPQKKKKKKLRGSSHVQSCESLHV
ncbi:hypothetical protein INR49_017877 [Caranx melampygus]|nr:hypothetical protein INR49_017877 [Caranx melampygus]